MPSLLDDLQVSWVVDSTVWAGEVPSSKAPLTGMASVSLYILSAYGQLPHMGAGLTVHWDYVSGFNVGTLQM